MNNKSCCGQEQHQADSCHSQSASKPDWLLRAAGTGVLLLYLVHWLALPVGGGGSWAATLSHTAFEMMNTMWWGLILAALFVGLLDRIPQTWVMAVLGRGNHVGGILRATSAGVLLDLCSHGILMVAMKLYQRGASLGQVMAFLVASPWNSLSLTIILIALIGWGWTLVFMLLSMVVGVVTGLVIDRWVAVGRLPANPATSELPHDFKLGEAIRSKLSIKHINAAAVLSMLWGGFRGSRMVLRWVFLGVLLAALIRAFVPLDIFQTLFGPSLIGLGLTLVSATIIEVCSEGSTPIAADIFNRASAPGNSFTFLMAGVSTDYTEIMSIKDTTHSWKIALALPLVTLPQIVLIGALLNLV
jgi:uncharacterized protein